MGIHEDLQGFMRLWERICGDLQGFVKLWEMICETLVDDL